MIHSAHRRRSRAPQFVLLLFALFFAAAGAAAGQGAELTSGTIRGTVYDKDFGVPLPGARVTIVELGLAVLTTKDGVFTSTASRPGATRCRSPRRGSSASSRTA